MKSSPFRLLWKAVAALAILLLVLHAPEFAFLIDAAYLDVFAILLASTALNQLASLRDGVRFVRTILAHAGAGLKGSLLARPQGMCLSATFAVAALVMMPCCLYVLPLFGLPALVPAGAVG